MDESNKAIVNVNHNLVNLDSEEPEPGCSGRRLPNIENNLDDSLTDELSDDENICRSPTKSPVKKYFHESRNRGNSFNESNVKHLEQDLPSDQDFQFKTPKFRKKKFLFHPFVRNSENSCVPDSSRQPIEVVIPEQLAASYGLYIWPSAPVLAWFIWLNQEKFIGKCILELGAGTALPGLLAAKLGASKVILTDSLHLPHCIKNCEEGVQLNDLKDIVSVQPLTWGQFTLKTLQLRDKVDFIIGSDLFFDPQVFEPLVVTVSWLLDNNPGARFICTVQERSADWSIESLLLRWNLASSIQYPSTFLKGTGINEADLTGNHQIFVLTIWKK